MMLIQSWHEEYTPLLDYYHQLIQKLASNQNNELIHLQQRKTLGLKRSNETLTLNPVLSPEDNPIKLLAVKVQTKLDDLLENEEPKHYIIEENKQITEQIKQSNFKFSEKTRQRITKEINEIISHSETEGIGPYQVAEQIRDKFAELKGYEANRIARTEINRADNTYRYDDIMNNDLIDYIQWYGHDDGKERDSHIKCNGEIIRKGELFSNGLRYPGDPQAPAKEVINCRCTIVPYIPPFDKMVPTGMDSFKEGDLIDKPENAGTQFLLETIENTRIITPTQGGANINLNNISISNVKETLGKLSQQTLDGYLKTKKEVQTTLDKLLGINKKTKTTGISKIKKKLHDNWKQGKPTTLDDIQPSSTIKTPKPVNKPKPIVHDNLEDKSVKELEEIKNDLENALEQKVKQKASYTLTQEEQVEHDTLMERLLENGGSLDIKKGKVIINNKGLSTTEVNKLKKLKEKQLNILKQKPKETITIPKQEKTPTEPVPKQALTTSEQKEYDKLLNKLHEKGVTVQPSEFNEYPVFIQNNEQVLYPEGLLSKEISKFEELFAKQKKANPKLTIKPKKSSKINKAKNTNETTAHQSNASEPTRTTSSRQMTQQEMSNEFREENPEITRKMDDFGLREGEHYHYVQDNDGNTCIRWNSNDGTEIREKVDSFLENFAPESAYPEQQLDARDFYTDIYSSQMNEILLLRRKFNTITNNKQFKEKFIELHGSKKYKKFIERDLPHSYQKACNEYVRELEEDIPREVLFDLMKSFENTHSKMPVTTRLFRGQDKFYGQIPHVGDTDTLGIFYSATHNYNVVDNFADEVIIELDVVEDTDALLICSRGCNGLESEILLKPTQKVECTNVFHDDDGILHVRYKTIDIEEKTDVNEWFEKLISYE